MHKRPKIVAESVDSTEADFHERALRHTCAQKDSIKGHNAAPQEGEGSTGTGQHEHRNASLSIIDSIATTPQRRKRATSTGASSRAQNTGVQQRASAHSRRCRPACAR